MAGADMRIFCKLGRHEAGTRIAYNAGTYFATCTHCTGPLILSAKGWREVPKGYRVVWKGRRTQDIAFAENQLELSLPAPGEPSQVPAKRALPRTFRARKSARATGAASAPSRRRRRHPAQAKTLSA